MNTPLRLSLLLAFALTSAASAFDANKELERGVGNIPLVETPRNDGGQVELRSVLALGKFPADSVDAAIDQAFFDEAKAVPREGEESGGLNWFLHNENGERIIVNNVFPEQVGDTLAVYFSYWIFTPEPIVSDQGLETMFICATKAKMYLNGTLLETSDPVTPWGDETARFLYKYNNLELKQGWNHFLIKLAGYETNGPDGEGQSASLAWRMKTKDPATLDTLTMAPAVNP